MNDRLEKASNGTYNNLILVIMAIAAFYLLVSGFTKSKQQAYLDGAGLDKATQQAQALRDAMNRSGIGIMMSVDGTDVELIMQTGAAITDYKAVSDAYRVLFPGSELTQDLSNELSRVDLQNFWNAVYKVNPTGGSTSVNVSLSGRSIVAKQTTNIRQDKAPAYGSIRQAVKGESLGKYVSEKVLPDVPNKGDRGVFVKFSQEAFFGLYSVEYWVLKAAVNII